LRTLLCVQQIVFSLHSCAHDHHAPSVEYFVTCHESSPGRRSSARHSAGFVPMQAAEPTLGPLLERLPHVRSPAGRTGLPRPSSLAHADAQQRGQRVGVDPGADVDVVSISVGLYPSVRSARTTRRQVRLSNSGDARPHRAMEGRAGGPRVADSDWNGPSSIGRRVRHRADPTDDARRRQRPTADSHHEWCIHPPSGHQILTRCSGRIRPHAAVPPSRPLGAHPRLGAGPTLIPQRRTSGFAPAFWPTTRRATAVRVNRVVRPICAFVGRSPRSLHSTTL